MNAKKQARRNAAASRFTILNRSDWEEQFFKSQKTSDAKFGRFNERVPNGGEDAGYDAYVAAKKQEAAALGL